MYNLQNKVVTKVVLNTNKSTHNTPPFVYAKQYDENSRYIVATIKNGDEELILSGQVQLNAVKPDGKKCYIDGAINSTDNTVVFALTGQLLSVCGTVKCDVLIKSTQNGIMSTITASTFLIIVEESYFDNDAIESVDGESSLSIPKIYIGANEPQDPTHPMWLDTDEDDVRDIYQLLNIYTTIEKVRGTGGRYLRINVHGLQESDFEDWSLHMYTVSRKGFSKYGSWRHPDNYDSEGTHKIGYGDLAGKDIYASDESVGKVRIGGFPSVQEWMPNYGFLQTEWDVSECMPIDIETWMLPMVKPKFYEGIPEEDDPFGVESSGSGWCGLVGLKNGHTGSLLFKFCLVRKSDGYVAECKQTVRLAGAIANNRGVNVCEVNGEKYLHGLYCSVV